ncbi:MAG: isocitrate lyase [Ignavibacteriales bacterium]|nr:isocitrate lyase [Ignavibacteriales bacterium]
MTNKGHISELSSTWAFSRRWQGIERPYLAEDVIKLRGSIRIEHTLASMGTEKLLRLLDAEPFVKALGALSGNQAIQQVKAGLQAIYVSGWQVAADANDAGQMYPDMSLYPADSVPNLVRRINNALRRADQIQSLESRGNVQWFAPIVADGEAGFGGILNTYEIMYAMIEAGAAAVHFEDQLASLKKCGHMGGKVLVPSHDFIQKLIAARLASDVAGVPTVIIARTDALSGQLLQGEPDAVDDPFVTGERTEEGYVRVKGGLEHAIARALAYAPYADMLWCETNSPDLGEAKEFARAIHEKYPGKYLAYNCSPSFNWRKALDQIAIARFQDELALMGYKFQFVTLAGFHTLNASMFELARMYRDEGMAAYARLQDREFDLELTYGFDAVKHQRFVGTGYYDKIQTAVVGNHTSTTALKNSTEEEQFK